MGVTNIVALLGGVALFLFGMSVMGSALKKVAGNKLEVILYRLTSNPIKGILLGTGVTAVIQSSSATSVMVVGFVNSGMMKVDQAIGIILGAILGTSITGWVLCLNSIGGSGASIAVFFSTAMLTGIVALIGIILHMFCKKQSLNHIGEIMLGFAVLMYGMTAMSGAVAPLKESPEFIGLLTKFSNPILGILVGIAFTSLLQSASAAVGILQALAVTGAITFDIALPIIMGIGIGASVPVLLSALGASVNGKRTAWIYLIIDVLGAVIVGIVFYAANFVVHFGFMDMTMNMVSIAFTNTLYRLAVVIVLAPFINWLEKIVVEMFPDDPEALAEQAEMDRLETRFLQYPPIALEQCGMVISSMAKNTKKSIYKAISIRAEYDDKTYNRVVDLEALIDRYEDKLGSYLMKLTGNDLDEHQVMIVSKYLHALSDLERISDHARNISEAAEEIQNKKISFSGRGLSELVTLEDAIREIVDITIDSFVNNDASAAMHVEPLEEVIDGLCDEMKLHHIQRLQTKECTLENGFAFNDLITNYERVADHCSNIAIAVVEAVEGMKEYNPHEFAEAMVNQQNGHFKEYFEQYKEKYEI